MICLRHVRAMVLRHWYIFLHSPPYIINIVCWPIMNILVWGFMNHHMSQVYGAPDAQARYIGGTLIMAAMFWDLFIRASWGFTGTIVEEFHSRNLGGLMASPLGNGSYIFGCALVSFMKGLVAFIAVPLIVSGVFGFSVFTLGWHLLPYVVILLLSGWAFGLLMASLLFVWSLRAEPLCWFTPMIACALMAPYYPVDSLPAVIQPVAMAMPATYVFEAMRADMSGVALDWSFFPKALLLCVVWFGVALFLYKRAYNYARRQNLLLAIGN